MAEENEVPSWDMDESQMKAFRKVYNLKRVCVCGWGSACPKAQVIFTWNMHENDQSDTRGGECISLKLHAKDPRTQKWQNAVLSNIGAKPEVATNKFDVPVARHHWTAKQLDYFKNKPSVGVEFKVWKDLVHSQDKEDYYEIPGTGKKKDTVIKLYFHTPNVPKTVAQNEAQVLVSTRKDRVAEREAAKEKKEAREQRKRQDEAREATLKRKREQFERDKLMNVREWRDERDQKDAEIASLQSQIEELQARFESDLKIRDDRITKLEEEATSGKLEVAKLRRKVRRSEQRANSDATQQVTPGSTRKRTRTSNSSGDGVNDSDEPDQSFQQKPSAWDLHMDFQSMLVIWGGLSRLTLTNDKWHERHREAAAMLFGFETWTEAKYYISSFFPDVETRTTWTICRGKNNEITVSERHLTTFERCVACKLFFHSAPHRGKVALIFGVSDDVISRSLKTWHPRWGKAGEQISILILTPEYLKKDTPQIYRDRGIEQPMLADGKDFMVQFKRKHNTLQRHQISSKVKTAAGRSVGWDTGAGLTVEHSYMMAGRATEEAIVKLWGELGRKKAPLETWKDFAKTIAPNTNYFALNLYSVLQSVDHNDGIACRKVHHEASSASSSTESDDSDYKEGDSDSSVDGGDGESTSADLVGFDDDDDSISDEDSLSDDSWTSEEEEEEEEEELPLESTSVAPPQQDSLVTNILEDFEFRINAIGHDKERGKSGQSKKTSLLLDKAEVLRAEAKAVLEHGPQSSAIEVLCQLELHERLHRLYEGRKLQKCLLSYYIKLMERDRLQILHHLGSSMVPEGYDPDSMVPEGYDPASYALPDIWQRLAKIPKEAVIIADKGFKRNSGLYPNYNQILAPAIMRERNVKQTLPFEMEGDRGDKSIKTLRYTKESAFSRVTEEDALKDIIPYRNLSLIQSIHSWGYGNINIRMPFRKPGWSPDGYWDNATFATDERKGKKHNSTTT